MVQWFSLLYMHSVRRVLYFLDVALLWWKYRHNRGRAHMLNKALDFCRCNNVEGDYFEFGVFQGAMCEYAHKASRLRGRPNMQVFAFDSFEGFSEPQGADDIGILKKGGRTCSLEQFQTNMRMAGVEEKDITAIPGFFEETLQGPKKEDTIQKIGNRKAAIVYVDCDLYEPARDVLAFIRPYLVDGSIVVFDNWFLFKGSPFRGERKACAEWLTTHPDIVVSQFHKFGWHGESFIVSIPSSHDAH